MNFLLPILALALLLVCWDGASAQAPKESSEVIKQLLSAPAPPPRSAETQTEPKKPRPANFLDKANVPPDDAPIEDLVDYWLRWSYKDAKHAPSETVRKRLLDGSLDDLMQLVELLELFTVDEDEINKIKEVFDKTKDKSELGYQRDEIRKWLLLNSKHFIGELFSLANKVKDKDEFAFVENGEALEALAKLDWTRAKPLLETLVNTGQQRSSTLALTLLHRHSIEEKELSAELKFRSQLQSIASNRNFAGSARKAAIEELSKSEWSGRDEWYLSLFNDDSLIDLNDGNHVFSPLSILFTLEPDKWIPVMTKMVAGKDRTQQQAAAICLARYAVVDPRRDVIIPVLRWLTDPDWIPIGSNDRARFMQTMNEVDVPESIPGLIWIVENDKYNGKWAAVTLAHYKDARAIPALKKALTEANEADRKHILEGLIASGGLTETEQVDALEAFAEKILTESGREDLKYRSDNEKLPLPVSIGRYLAYLDSPSENLVPAVLARAAQLKTTNPALSRSLIETAHNWQSRQIDLDLVKRIAANTAEANTIITALNRRTKLRETVEPEVRLLLVASGVPQGIGVILLEDNTMAAAILGSSDQAAQIGLLASARLTQTPLPVDLVGPLLKSKNPLLATAAERYLLAEDSKTARTLLWELHPNEAFITGWRENIELEGGSNFDLIGKLEEKLRAELLKPDGPLEIFALLENSQQYKSVLRIYADKTIYTYFEDSSRYLERVVPKDDLAVFKKYVTTSGVADYGPQFGDCHHNCFVSEFVILSKAAGRRVFSHEGVGTMMKIMENFHQLGEGEGATTHYTFEKDLKGLEVLYRDPILAVRDVWKSGDDTRILVQLVKVDAGAEDDEDDEDNEEDANARASKRHQKFMRSQASFSWRFLKDKKAGSITTVPDGYITVDESKFPFDEHDESLGRHEDQVQVLTPDSLLLARNEEGLWKQNAGAKPVRISSGEGAYANPIVTPDRKWAVVAKTDSHWYTPNYVVRFNLETGREYRTRLEPADQLDPIAFVPVHEKILLLRDKDDQAVLSGRIPPRDTAEYYLVDPKTGAVEPVSGEFAPLRQGGKRFLQSAGEVGQYWAAIPDRLKNQTQVGRYNVKDFSFKTVLTVPHINFQSMEMWVDEKEGKLYLVYKSQLLRLPLKSAAP